MIKFVISTYETLEKTEETPIRNALSWVRWSKSPKKPWDIYTPTFRILIATIESVKSGWTFFGFREYRVMEYLLTVPNRTEMFQ